MALKPLKRISRTLVSANPWWSYFRDEFTLPNGSTGVYHNVWTPGSVVVIPVTDSGRILMVNQFRYLNQRESLEFVGGGLPKDCDVLDAAKTECREEAGASADHWLEAGRFDPYNGVTDEMCTVFIATGLHRQEMRPEPSEEFEIREVTPSELDRMIADGTIWDGMTLAAWMLARGRVLVLTEAT